MPAELPNIPSSNQKRNTDAGMAHDMFLFATMSERFSLDIELPSHIVSVSFFTM